MNGAQNVYGACTARGFSGNAIERINNSSLKKIIRIRYSAAERKSLKIEVKSIANLFAEAIVRTNKDQSITSLFDNVQVRVLITDCAD